MLETKMKFALFLLGMLLLASLGLKAADSPPTKEMLVDVGRARIVNLNQPIKAVFIANPEVAAYQVPNPNRIIVFGVNPGQTTLIATNNQGDVIFHHDITVANDLAMAKEMLAREFPHLTLRLASLPDGIMVAGDVPDAQTAGDVVALLDAFATVASTPLQGKAAEAAGASGSDAESSSGDSSSGSGSGSGGSSETGAGRGKKTMGARSGKVINRLRITTPTQVAIHIRFAEVNRRVTEELGFKWRLSGKSFGFGSQSGGIFFGEMGAAESVAGLIDALATENLVSILAEPNLSVVSGETASFLAGGEIPFPVPDGDGGTNIEFRSFGVLLGVTATVLSPNRISLRVAPEVSQPNYANGTTINGTVAPGFNVRKAETTIELASGQSFALAGLIQNDVTNSVNKIPGIGDIPVLGALARSKSFERSETELVIIATAYIINPSDKPLAIPNEKIKISDPWRRMWLNKSPEVGATDVRSDQFIF